MQPITNEAIFEILKSEFTDAIIEVVGDGYKYQALIVSSDFTGLSTVKRHQKIYSVLKDAIASGSLHALTLKTLTPDEYSP